jgi:peptidoglycan endopeptidase LytE
VRAARCGGPILFPFHRFAGVLCALALSSVVVSAALADDGYGHLRPAPSDRGGRREPPPAVTVVGAPPTPTATPTPQPTPTTGQRIIGIAQQYVGAPYVLGGASPVTGFDCSGLVQWVLGQLGVTVGHDAAGQYGVGDPVPSDQLAPGDLVFFANTYMPGITHVGVYVGNGEFVDAGTERTGVRRASLKEPYWAARFVGARRVR